MTKAPKAAPAPAGALSTDDLALAAQHVELLREIHAGDHATKTDLAKHLGRDLSNLNKTLKILADAGLAHAEGIGGGLPDKGQRALKAIDKAAGAAPDEPGSSSLPAGMIALLHGQICPDPENARKDWESEEAKAELLSLASDIKENGLLQNLVVRPNGGTAKAPFGAARFGGEDLPLYTLVGGERRWRALYEMTLTGDWPEDRPIICRVLETDDLGHKLAGLAENLQRRNLNPIEKAKAFEGLSAHLSNAEIAEKVGCTPEHVQQHRRFLKLSDKEQHRMTLPASDPNHLSIRDARYALNNIKAPPATLSRDETLILVELYWLAEVEGGERSYWGARVEVAPNARELGGKALASLEERNFLDLIDRPDHRDGRFYARLSWMGSNWVREAHPKLTKGKKEARAKALALIQAPELKGESPYSGSVIGQAMLKGPFDLTPEGQALADAFAEAEAERERAAAESEKQRAEREARYRSARQAVTGLQLPLIATGDVEVANMVAAVGNLDLPFPWSVNERAEVIAANGKTAFATRAAWGAADDKAIALALIVANAANASAGHAMPSAPKAPDEAEFVGWMAGRLQLLVDNLTPEAGLERTKTMLAEFLSDNGIAFGDEDYDWSSDGAAELVNDSLELEQAA